MRPKPPSTPLPLKYRALRHRKQGKRPCLLNLASSLYAPYQLTINLRAARYALAQCKQHLPLGPVNQTNTYYDNPQSKCINQQAKTTAEAILHLRRIMQVIGSAFDLLTSTPLQGGFCGEMSFYALRCLADSPQFKHLQLDLVIFNDHQILAIGRQPDSAPEDYTTWGKETVLCDPWAGIHYTTNKLPKLQHSHRISYISFNDSGAITSGPHNNYLAGKPRIQPGMVNIKQSYLDWCKQKQTGKTATSCSMP